jgi:polar amino acid transport system substrate-binding protein
MLRSFRTVVAASICLTVALAAASCGSSSGSGSSPAKSAAGEDKTLAAMVPKSIASKGVLSVGSDTTYAPSEFLAPDNKTPVGFDVDLIDAVAKLLGLKANVQTAVFDKIIPGITQSKKFDIGVSSFSVNADREKQVDMITYYSAGMLWAQPKGGDIDPDNACGKKVAVQTSTVEADDLASKSKDCTTAGKDAIQIDQFSGQDDATQALVSGKDDAMSADSPITAYAIKQLGGKIEVAGKAYSNAPYAYAIAKHNGQLAQALQGAVKKLIDNGQYASILKKWGVDAGAITSDQVQINPPAS